MAPNTQSDGFRRPVVSGASLAILVALIMVVASLEHLGLLLLGVFPLALLWYRMPQVCLLIAGVLIGVGQGAGIYLLILTLALALRALWQSQGQGRRRGLGRSQELVTPGGGVGDSLGILGVTLGLLVVVSFLATGFFFGRLTGDDFSWGRFLWQAILSGELFPEAHQQGLLVILVAVSWRVVDTWIVKHSAVNPRISGGFFVVGLAIGAAVVSLRASAFSVDPRVLAILAVVIFPLMPAQWRRKALPFGGVAGLVVILYLGWLHWSGVSWSRTLGAWWFLCFCSCLWQWRASPKSGDDADQGWLYVLFWSLMSCFEPRLEAGIVVALAWVWRTCNRVDRAAEILPHKLRTGRTVLAAVAVLVAIGSSYDLGWRQQASQVFDLGVAAGNAGTCVATDLKSDYPGQLTLMASMRCQGSDRETYGLTISSDRDWRVCWCARESVPCPNPKVHLKPTKFAVPGASFERRSSSQLALTRTSIVSGSTRLWDFSLSGLQAAQCDQIVAL